MYSADNFGMAKVGNELKPYKKYYTAEDYTPWIYENRKRQGKNVAMIPPCVYGSYVVDYLNRYSVRTAFHIPDAVQAWTYCTDSTSWSYTRGQKASFDIYKDFKANYPNVNILIYSGDTDGSVPTWGTLEWIDALGWKQT
jgi:carboxypeptidase C (cathepsin A)